MQSNKTVMHVHSTYLLLAVEICAKLFGSNLTMRAGSRGHDEPEMAADRHRRPEAVRACSACAGDYEDPDRTAWTLEESDEGEDENAPEPSAEEFPAGK